jgi:23S rRNA (adenine2030-N6)-methyltransferase
MNYRHAFHAGNFADVFKHIFLSRILLYLIKKPAPLRYIDTHAGLGWYDLDSSEALRTGEWRNGIARLDPTRASPAVRDLLAPYLDALGPRDDTGKPSSYPGSPGIAQHILRPADRLLLCELHPDDAPALRRAMGRDKRVKVLTIDGYTALAAYVPPPERRGLVLIDPPFEEKTEFDTLVRTVAIACRKWPTGTYAIWYPIKEPGAVASFSQHLRAIDLAEFQQIELTRDPDPARPGALRGCGLFIINPPYTLGDEAALLLPFLIRSLSEPGTRPWRARLKSGTSETREF